MADFPRENRNAWPQTEADPPQDADWQSRETSPHGNEPRPAAAVPECPAELGPLARTEWNRLVGKLAALRLLTNLDRAALAAYCGAYALWAEATAQIQKYGAMIKSPTGFPIQSPYLAIANRQAEIMMRIASEFGFTPASRSHIATPSPSDPTMFDLFDKSKTGNLPPEA